jgi:hypothetical protein
MFEKDEDGAMSLPCLGWFDDCKNVVQMLNEIRYARIKGKKFMLKAQSTSGETSLSAKLINIGGIDYKQITLIYLHDKADKEIDPWNYIPYNENILNKNGSSEKKHGFEYLMDKKEFFKIIIDDDTSKISELKVYLFGDGKMEDPNQMKIDSAIDYMEQFLGNTYKSEIDSESYLRTELSDAGTKKMDCAEFVSRYLYQVCGLKNVPVYTTAGMLLIVPDGDNNLKFIIGSDDNSYNNISPGDVFLWRTKSQGHTGLVISYDITTDQVTIMEAIGESGAREESFSKIIDGYCKGCIRTSIYSRTGNSLTGHDGWVGYFKPVFK